MDTGNDTVVTEFILLGLSSRPELQPLIFALILTMYLVNLAGNSLIVAVAWTDPRLQTPMYFLLSQLSLLDMGFASITVPQLLVHTFSRRRTIPFHRCIAQFFFFVTAGNMEGYLLAAMAYDRLVAICRPLHYTSVLTRGLCVRLVVGPWGLNVLHALLHTVLVLRLSFCSRRILHFFCDVPALLQLSCTPPYLNELVVLTLGATVTLSPFLFILASYGRIGAAVLRLRSAAGLRKAASTCGSHVVVVSLFFGTVIRLYFTPLSAHNLDRDRHVAVFYTVVTPMLNPLIYSLRNREVKGAVRRLAARLRGTEGRV
ncbi:olfactory receptor 1361-like [Tachyglossus aculeatus]|uniref:olfactory receptor 1361-like n=1 Tax=Tachyglossus aculeatus TaxID=9261 RepID=UPI0018F79E9A|nr:olfactory receptor 1361-like [Tachyglossus aculeatus]